MNPPHLRVVGAPAPTCDFLRIFHGDRDWPLSAINRATKDAQFAYFPKSDTRDADVLAWAAKWNLAKYDVYFSINPVKPGRSSKAAKEDVLAVEWLQADCDPPGTLPPADLDVWRAGKLAELRAGKEGVPAPTMIVDSGRGFWLFWKLNRAVPVDGRGPMTAAVESYARGVGALYGADHCFNIDRIARLPGFVNQRPNVPPRKAAVLDYWPDRACDLQDMPAAPLRQTDAAPIIVQGDLVDDAAAQSATVAYLLQADPAVEGRGGRKQALDVLQRCKDLGCSESVALDLMEAHWMGRCTPAWEREELEHTARSLKRNDPIGVHHPAVIADYRQALAKKEFEHVAPAPGDLTGTRYHFPDPSTIPPREFLYGGHYVRQFVSATIAPTKVGKSSLGIAEALAMASGKPLLGVEPRGQFRVRIWNGEDPWNEMIRRIAAAIQHYGLTEADLGDRLLVDSGREMPLILATQMRSGAALQVPVVSEIVRVLRAQAVDVMLVDPFVSSHRVSENDNGAVDLVVKAWANIADQTGCAVELVHHSRKLNGGEASIEDARGASALVSAVRSARALAKMTKGEAERSGLSEGVWRRLFRFTDASSNMAPPVAGELERWLLLESVGLGNGPGVDVLDRMLNGDSVGVVRLFDAGQAAEKEAHNLLGRGTETGVSREEALLQELASGDWRWSAKGGESWAGYPVARHFDLDAETTDGRAHAKKLLDTLRKDGRIRLVNGRSASRNKCELVEVVRQDVQNEASDLFGNLL